MDPCPFVRINIGNLALKFPAKYRTPVDSCYCKIKLSGGFATQFSTVPVIQDAEGVVETRVHACYTLKKSELEKMVERLKGKCCSLKIEIFSGRSGIGCGFFNGGKRVGSVAVALDLKGLENSASSSRGCVLQNGWVEIKGSSGAGLHVNVKSEPDPRFVFQFDGEPECSPQVFQVNGNVKQPVFSCKFSFRNGDRNLRSRSSLSEPSTSANCFSGTEENEKPGKERKGWSITIHDLSGSPVAAASMVTPFVPSPGSDRVSRSNPGAWLILRPGQGTWKPWGRLEAWRESGAGDPLGFRFELIPDGITDTVTLVNSTISMKNGGNLNIDIMNGPTPLTSPSSSFDFGSGSWSGPGSDFGSNQGSGSWAHMLYRGFVMSSTVAGDGKRSMPEVEVGVQHVSCTEDAAAFVALAAAMDLSMDACRSFSQKLRKELRQADRE
nr:uncharacterized protein LOC109161384 [Ipomoea trifida]